MSSKPNAPADDAASGVLGSLRGALTGIGDSASVDRVYGDPIEVDGKTVVPVARVAYGFGGGYGSGDGRGDRSDGDGVVDGDYEGADSGEGGGGGGGVRVKPAGVLDITETDTRFVPLGDRRKTVASLLGGLLLGYLLARLGSNRGGRC
ncbi:MAG: spore germination protein GerW family protein [Haloarculaceae archaeon]